ncbi:MAG: transposase [Burkholderiales bacterium]|nr:transposase [Burkholderiales bacterium]
MPLAHLPGHTQVVFGEVDGYIGGKLVRFHYFCLNLPQSILYDSTRLAVAKILGGGKRKRTKAFSELQSHCLFEDKFGCPGRGNDKGNVKGMIGFSRRHFMVPLSVFQVNQSTHRQFCWLPSTIRVRGDSDHR